MGETSISKEELQAIRETWERRQASKASYNAQRKVQARRYAREAAALLKDKYGVSKVILFGSLARDDVFDAHSDIDLFLEGWSDESKYWHMLADVKGVVGSFPVNIVTERDVQPSLMEAIRREGKEL